ncbi:hypothetical protein L6164_023218 [Bauhinia variegata]|uniref:Uncharacterized protein n=1 Tax=Bauhinia variegata TaxID=167791 RepID=A0ACB9MKS1_BAUVA|nr:hypothetical protein L6164_023218 [Bauhinia variegata]
MEGRRPRNRNTSSFSGPARPRSQKLPPDPTQHAKFTPSPRRGIPSTSDSDKARVLNSRNYAQEEDVDAESSSSFASIAGTCPYMCPEKERLQREPLRDLAVFERLHGNPRKSSPGLAVKKFCRTLSVKDVQASDVRPLPVLEDTVKHLLSLLDANEHPFEVVHDFVFDRTRSVRQDLSMQNIVNEKAIYLYEEMVKFHVISHYKLQHCISDPNMASMHHLNMEQLSKTLASLFNLYEANRNSNDVYQNEAEFHSLYVLLHLGSYSKPTGESLSLWFSRLSASVLKSKEMSFARQILRSFRIGNYKHFCAAAAQASYLQYCILEPFINEVRAMALSCINFGGYKLHPYPLVDLSKLLMMKESDVVSLCNACGLETCTDESGNKLLPTKQTTFCHPKGGFQSYSFLGLEEFEK